MKIVKVRNHLMYHDQANPNGYHYYAFYWNKKYNRYNAVRLTHIAIKDSKRYTQADRGLIKPIRIKQLDKYADNGITKDNYISDINGNRLNPNIGTTVIVKVSDTSASKIKRFGTRIVYRGKHI